MKLGQSEKHARGRAGWLRAAVLGAEFADLKVEKGELRKNPKAEKAELVQI
jgi:hypothetical protein